MFTANPARGRLGFTCPGTQGQPNRQNGTTAGIDDRRHETVLVVEDESSILDLCKIMLEQQGYEVLAAATPTEAIELAGAQRGDSFIDH